MRGSRVSFETCTCQSRLSVSLQHYVTWPPPSRLRLTKCSRCGGATWCTAPTHRFSDSPVCTFNSAQMHVRMTGCPNGCARPYMAELGLVGDGPNSYQLYLGGSSNQTRLAEVYMERMKMQV